MKRLLILIFAVFASLGAAAQTFKENVLGGMNLQFFYACLFFALIGVVISLLVDATSRDSASPNTPVKFTWKFLIKDNWKRILLSLILIIVTIRFLKELTGLELNMFYALCVGISWDKLSEFLKKKSEILQVKR